MENKGFTLMELLVVIGLIAILLVIAIPSVLNVKNNALKGISKQEEANIKDASLLVAVELDDYESEIYNCKSGSWIASKCSKSSDNKWTSFSITLNDLIEHGYFSDKEKHCKGSVIVTKNTKGTYKEC